jgi:opacity protein-like surface antigen
MSRISFVAVAVGVTLAAATAPILAQSIGGTPIQFGVMGGATTPVGDVAFVTHHDWSLGALASVGSPQSHLSFRVDGQWQRLAGRVPITGLHLVGCFECQAGSQPRAQSYRVLDLTTNAVYNFAPTASKSFYVVGGVGAYNERQYDPASDQSQSVTRFGFNAGAGLKFRVFRHRSFIELRYHDIVGAHSFASEALLNNRAGSFQFIPINVGFLF